MTALDISSVLGLGAMTLLTLNILLGMLVSTHCNPVRRCLAIVVLTSRVRRSLGRRLWKRVRRGCTVLARATSPPDGGHCGRASGGGRREKLTSGVAASDAGGTFHLLSPGTFMRAPHAIALAAVFIAACATPERSTAVLTQDGGARLTQNTVDTVGLPDLIVDSKATQNNWVNRTENLPANFCSVQEGGVTPGYHDILRFTVETPNVGDADVFVGSPLKHMDPNGDGNFADQDGLYEFATCHGHFHFKHYATYRLVDEAGHVWKAAKRGFCMLDTDPYNTHSGDGTWNYRSCGNLTVDGFQGISSGWADTYTFKLGGQYFVLDGGDGQPVVPPGTYHIQVEVNPAYAPDGAGNCPRVKDPATGMCHQFAERSYSNNFGDAVVQVSGHPGRAGYGSLKNTDTITADDDKAQ